MNLDPRLNNLGISVKANPSAMWGLTSAQYQDETQAGGNHNVYFTVLDAAGNPLAGKVCIVDYPQDPSDPHPVFKTQTDANGQCDYPMYANLDITLKNGPYFAYVEDPSKSDVVSGMGLPEHRHVNYVLTFNALGGSPPPPPPLPASLDQTAIANAQKYAWMPINTDGALYKFALSRRLGYPQTDEFEFTYGGDTYVGQVYNLGIVYVKKGDWGNSRWVKKP
jgi:hypothetical protein